MIMNATDLFRDRHLVLAEDVELVIERRELSLCLWLTGVQFIPEIERFTELVQRLWWLTHSTYESKRSKPLVNSIFSSVRAFRRSP